MPDKYIFLSEKMEALFDQNMLLPWDLVQINFMP